MDFSALCLVSNRETELWVPDVVRFSRAAK